MASSTDNKLLPLHEELACLILHDLIDDIFDDGDRGDHGARAAKEEDGEDPCSLLPPDPEGPPTVTPVASLSSPYSPASASWPPKRPPPAGAPGLPPPPVPKRRRLGVNAGAHEQILLLRATLDMVTKERDAWRDKCRETQAKLEEATESALQLESEASSLRRIVGHYRRASLARAVEAQRQRQQCKTAEAAEDDEGQQREA